MKLNKKIEAIEKQYQLLDRFINKSKLLNKEEIDNLTYSIKYILYIILKYSTNNKGRL